MLRWLGVVSITEDREHVESIDPSAQNQYSYKARVGIPICFELSCLALRPKTHYIGLE